jgi:hypothetical protein
MTQARAAFQSQLRDAVREAHAPRSMPSTRQAAAPGRPRRRVSVRLWLPLTPLWLILAPFALIAAPLLLLAPDMRGVRPFRAALAIGATLFALSGTVVDVDTPDALVRLRII